LPCFPFYTNESTSNSNFFHLTSIQRPISISNLWCLQFWNAIYYNSRSWQTLLVRSQRVSILDSSDLSSLQLLSNYVKSTIADRIMIKMVCSTTTSFVKTSCRPDLTHGLQLSNIYSAVWKNQSRFFIYELLITSEFISLLRYNCFAIKCILYKLHN
jgi:hypothetical protein